MKIGVSIRRSGYTHVEKSETILKHESDLRKEMKSAMRDLVENEQEKKSKTIVYLISVIF
jgi:hypothetical protein